MRLLRGLWSVLTARWLWVFIAVVLICAVIWFLGHHIALGDFKPLASDVAKLIAILAVILVWGLANLVAQRRAQRANQVFVTELVEHASDEPSASDAARQEVTKRFSEVLEKLKKHKDRRKLLRELPWYVIIGPPGTGKTTALKQSGIKFWIDTSEDLRGFGGTRNCDWFFAEEAVLIDTAGRYTTQEKDAEADAAEWSGFLDLLKKHRGRKALNGVIVTLSCDTILGGSESLRVHAQEIRNRLAEIEDRLQIRLPVYLVLTKTDFVEGFTSFFDSLTTQQREQVWGVTFGTDEIPTGSKTANEIEALASQLELRISNRINEVDTLSERSRVFRFPSAIQALSLPASQLIDLLSTETRYQTTPWLRGFYLTSATQSGNPLERLVGELSMRFGLPVGPSAPPPRLKKRSFFLTSLFRDVIFREAGLGIFNPQVAKARLWTWRGSIAAAAAIVLVAALSFMLSYLDDHRAIAKQTDQFSELNRSLEYIADQPAGTESLDLYQALIAVDEVVKARTKPPHTLFTMLGPGASSELLDAQETAYLDSLKSILEPRMVALVEATLWNRIRDPEFLLDGLKAYLMLTGRAAFEKEFVIDWWTTTLPTAAPIDPFPDELGDNGVTYQLEAFARLARDNDRIEADAALVRRAQESIRSVPLAVRAYRDLLNDPDVVDMPDWIPDQHAGPRGRQVLVRRSGKSLRTGISGAFTYNGFHDAILKRIDDVASQAALDDWVFEGTVKGEVDPPTKTLKADILKLYYDDYIDVWDAFLADITLAPLKPLDVAVANLKDLSGPDSALQRLLSRVVEETELTRPREKGGGGPPTSLVKKAAKAVGLGKVAKVGAKGAKIAAKAGKGEADTSGRPVAEHFLELKASVQEVDGAPPALDNAVAALGALAAQLQSIQASPDPGAALVARGGLSELTKSVAKEAAQLPDPLDGWLAGVSTDTASFSGHAIREELNAVWRADVLPFCQKALAGRYPFVPDSRIDVNVVDFQRLFGPGGLIDSFIETELAGLIDKSRRPWRWQSVSLSPHALAALEQARNIRDGLFATGSGPSVAFTLKPIDLSPAASRVRLDLDGQELIYYNNLTPPTPMSWPGPNGTNIITLTFWPVDGSADVFDDETGAWSLLRLIRSGEFRQSSLPELYRLKIGRRGHWAEFELRAASVENPFDLSMFGSFACPPRL